MTYTKSRIYHGESTNRHQSTEYACYHQAKYRCNNPNSALYKYYGGRGIEFRFESFAQFLGHLGRKPTPAHTLERKETNGHYEIGNVEWELQQKQMWNIRSNRNLTVDGVTRCVAEWAFVTGKHATTIFKRLHIGYCDECAVKLGYKEKCPHR